MRRRQQSSFDALVDSRNDAPNGHHQRPEPVFRAAKKLEDRLLRKLYSNRFRSVCMVLLGIKYFNNIYLINIFKDMRMKTENRLEVWFC